MKIALCVSVPPYKIRIIQVFLHLGKVAECDLAEIAPPAAPETRGCRAAGGIPYMDRHAERQTNSRMPRRPNGPNNAQLT